MTVGVPKTPCASAGMKIDDRVPLARGRVPPHHIQKEPKRGSGVPPLLSPHRIVYFHTVVYTPIFWYCPGRKLLTSGLLRLRALTAGRSTCCVHFLSVYFFSVYIRSTSVDGSSKFPIFGGGNATFFFKTNG